MKKAVAVVVVVALVALLGWEIYRRAAADGNQGGGRGRGGGAVVAVETVPVSRRTIVDVARFTGSLLPKSYFVVAPKIGGRLEKLLLNIGDAVHTGQLLAVLDDGEYSQQVQEAEAQLLVAKANMEEAKSALEVERREYERVQALRAKSIASESELDSSRARHQAQEARYKVAGAQVAQKAASLKAAEVRLSYARIVASWDDADAERFVGERFVDEGAMLRSNDPIISIIDISSLTAVIHVIERDYSQIRIGQPTYITTDAFAGETFAGKVLRVAPLLKETSRQARVEVEIPNPDRLLKPGMFVEAQIEFQRRDNATVVPLSALSRRNGSQGVFIADVEEMKARFVPVTLGITTDDSAEIAEPALRGLVVTLGQHLLSDGVSITLAGQDAEPPAAGAGGRGR